MLGPPKTPLASIDFGRHTLVRARLCVSALQNGTKLAVVGELLCLFMSARVCVGVEFVHKYTRTSVFPVAVMWIYAVLTVPEVD